MKKLIYSFVIITVSAMMLTACFKQKDTLLGTPTVNVSVASVRNLYTGSAVQLTEENTGVSRLAGTVISDVAGGNITKGQFVMVQTKDGVTAGIVVTLKDAEDVPYVPGDSLVIEIQGSTINRVKGSLQLMDIPKTKITKVAQGRFVKTLLITLDELAKNFNKYESMLVKIAGADLVPVPVANETYAGEKGLDDGSTDADVKLSTESGATFASTKVPVNANFTGIATYNNSQGNTTEGATMQLRMRSINDVEITSAPLNADLVISGFMADPRGGDAPAAGTSSGYSNGVTVVHKGSYEYIQLMALRDINFALTPYSVVVASNGTVTANGWAAGGTLTFKFNLTAGTAKAGTFLYVGGPGKVLGGYWNCGPTTDMSSGNWIRVINAPAAAYDDFGTAAATMGNMAGDGSNVADGIAVFTGTTVTPTSVPIDAVFYGTKITTAYNAANKWGYRVPLNDHYNPVNPETGEAQPFFGQGTNLYMYRQPAADVGDYSKLGGVVSKNAWIIPRETTSLSIGTLSCPEAAALNLLSIESGSGVTYFRK